MAVTVSAGVRHALIVQPTDTASDLAHSLLAQGLTVEVVADHPDARLVDLAEQVEVIHVGKIPRGEFTEQDVINRILVDRARAGRTVARLKGGDSFVFGRGGEEWNACVEAGIPVRVVPGVSSVT